MARIALVALLCTALCAIGPPAAAAVHIDPGRAAPVVMNANSQSYAVTTVTVGISSSTRALPGRDSPSMLGDRPADGAKVVNSSRMSMTAISAAPGADSS